MRMAQGIRKGKWDMRWRLELMHKDNRERATGVCQQCTSLPSRWSMRRFHLAAMPSSGPLAAAQSRRRDLRHCGRCHGLPWYLAAHYNTLSHGRLEARLSPETASASSRPSAGLLLISTMVGPLSPLRRSTPFRILAIVEAALSCRPRCCGVVGTHSSVDYSV